MNKSTKSQKSGKTCKATTSSVKSCRGGSTDYATAVNSVFEQMFENQAILTVRDNNGAVWFKAKDCATILGYTKTNTVKVVNRN